MPTKKFFDLSEDKRKAFIDAAIMEFEHQSFDEASIYNIARNAGVSRTGIYYYFTNKQDIYEYLLTLNRDRFFESIKSAGKLDIFEFFIKYFEFMATYKDTRNEKLIRQTYKNIKLLEVNTLDITIKKMNEKMESDFQLIDFSNLKDASPEVIGGMCLMGFGFVSRSLNSYFSGNQTYEEAKKQCEIFIDCLKNGFLK